MDSPDASEAVVYDTAAEDVDWDGIWDTPLRAHGDGSDYAESTANDGTPGTSDPSEDGDGGEW